METFNMAILFRSVWVSEDLCELIFFKKCLHRFGDKPTVIVITNLNLHLFPQAIVWLKIIFNDVLPDALDLSLYI
ncbi:MAG: hypothetical protein ACP5PZ_12095 [Bacteroidales bacterium]